MSRRVLISKATINKIVASQRRRQREEEKNELIQSQGGNEKEKTPTYHLEKVDFNTETRITKIEFCQTQEYRTIERYVTQNYVKYPIYSEWKVKHKKIHKTIKLTNAVLESLNVNSDELIRLFARDIIISLNREDLYPSWFLLYYLREEVKREIQEIDDEFSLIEEKIIACINQQQDNIKCANNNIKELEIKISKQESKKKKLEQVIENINAHGNVMPKVICTFGLWLLWNSQKRKEKIEKKLLTIKSIIEELNTEKKRQQDSICGTNNLIDCYKKDLQNADEKAYNLKVQAKTQYDQKCSQVIPLENTIKEDSGFIPISSFGGLEYEKIIGCYIIHNKEKDKYYVGQSKDVLRRLKQHFKGSVPNNPIFAEDYYTSQYNPRDNLFEAKIIRCEIKDELDRLEKQLISDYDAWQSGYNGTSGNN